MLYIGQPGHPTGQVLFSSHLPRDKFCQKYLSDPGYGMVQYGMVRVQYGMVWDGTVWYCTVLYGMAWYGII